jgi:hypothetical protein
VCSTSQVSGAIFPVNNPRCQIISNDLDTHVLNGYSQQPKRTLVSKKPATQEPEQFFHAI